MQSQDRDPGKTYVSHQVNQILAACHKPHDVHLLIKLATSTGGLINDEVRKIAWPVLLGYRSEESELTASARSWRELPIHKDEDQVELDVNRSFIYYPKNESDLQLDRRKRELSSVIVEVLREHPMLSYFQGFHDVVQVFLLVLGVDQAPKAVAHLSLLRIRDFMLPSLSASLAHLQLLPTILYVVDRELCLHLSQTQPFFALAATLTLYAHDIQEYGDIARLFDFLIAQPAVVSIYFFAVIIISRRDELYEIPAEEPEMLHSVLSKLPKPLDLEALISRTMTLFEEHPPESLPSSAWAKISVYSVLKTTRKSVRNQTLKDGEELFEYQALQLRRHELQRRAMDTIWKYRRPASQIGLAFVVGVVSIWIIRRAGPEGIPNYGLRKVVEILKKSR
ncbi:TBC1 domain family member 20 [Usnea florida]